jgi:hypothetical protein
MHGVKPLKVVTLFSGICFLLIMIFLIATGEGVIYSVVISIGFTFGLIVTGGMVLGILAIIELAVKPLIKPIVKLLEPLLKWLKS